MRKIFLLAVLGLCLVAGIARSDDAATETLIELLAPLSSLQGDFRQQQYAPGTEQAVATTTGQFKLLKPAYFSWEITAPDSQLIVTDGQHLWHHDRDLETVTRRPLNGQEEMSPLQVLAGDTTVLRERFEVSQSGQGRFLLTPIQGEPGFNALTLIFAAGQITGMEIVDNLNQRLFIELLSLDSTSALSPADFSFTPPEGADLFYHDQ